MQKKYSYLFKYIIIGDANVGKSCMLLQLIENKFKSNHQSTVGVQFGSRAIKIGQQIIKMQIWDTAGQETFKSITRSYYRGCIGAILVYDIANRNSFSNCQRWIKQTRQYAHSSTQIILVGNKNDLQKERVVTTEEGVDLAQKFNLTFKQCSAKDFRSVQNVFKTLSMTILSKIRAKTLNPQKTSLGIKIGNYIPGDRDDRNATCC